MEVATILKSIPNFHIVLTLCNRILLGNIHSFIHSFLLVLACLNKSMDQLDSLGALGGRNMRVEADVGFGLGKIEIRGAT